MLSFLLFPSLTYYASLPTHFWMWTIEVVVDEVKDFFLSLYPELPPDLLLDQGNEVEHV